MTMKLDLPNVSTMELDRHNHKRNRITNSSNGGREDDEDKGGGGEFLDDRLVKGGVKAEAEVVSVNLVYFKAGTPSPTVSACGSQFELVKGGVKAEAEVVSVNLVYFKAGTPSPTPYLLSRSQFELVKGGVKAEAEVVSVNLVYFKAGTPSPTGFVMNMQPSEAEAGFDIRIPPTEDPDLLKKRIDEEWAPATRNLTYQLIQQGPVTDITGRPLITTTDDSNPWWSAFKEAVIASGGKLQKPEILRSTTDARFMRQLGIPTLGFSPMANTPILLHEHNEFLNDTVFLKGIKVYEHVIRALSSLPAFEKPQDASV
ncbi:aminoacylase-1-like [Asparagus officinalis]|uniref:aminoacylase-1-like n=1 Tax=Asparagus officinalis TaxID=4686 RepID=UPI00098E0AED|nr:aminoacylase-1-like [Asparagus officinalis]